MLSHQTIACSLTVQFYMVLDTLKQIWGNLFPTLSMRSLFLSWLHCNAFVILGFWFPFLMPFVLSECQKEIESNDINVLLYVSTSVVSHFQPSCKQDFCGLQQIPLGFKGCIKAFGSFITVFWFKFCYHTTPWASFLSTVHNFLQASLDLPSSFFRILSLKMNSFPPISLHQRFALLVFVQPGSSLVSNLSRSF